MKRINNTDLLVNLLVVFAMLVVAKVNYCFPIRATQSDCVVSGKIQTNDVLEKRNDGVPYENANLVFHNEMISKTTKSDLAGGYSITLPTGIYEVSVKTLYNTIFYRRAAFNCQGKLVINIYPLMYQDMLGIKSTGPLNHKIETLGKSWTGSDKLNIVIAYLIKKKEKNLTSYQRNVYLTFDKYCIFAGEIVKDDKNKTLTATSFTWIEDGIERKKVEKVTLKFGKDGPKIDF